MSRTGTSSGATSSTKPTAGARGFQVRVTYPTGRTVVFDAPGEAITVGRTGGNGVRLTHPYVAPRHLAVRYRNGRFTVLDLGSESGTIVGGELLPSRSERTVDVGEVIEIGPLSLTLEEVLDVEVHELDVEGLAVEEQDWPDSFYETGLWNTPMAAELWAAAGDPAPRKEASGGGLPVWLGARRPESRERPPRTVVGIEPRPPVDLPWTPGLKLVGGVVLFLALAFLLVIVSL